MINWLIAGPFVTNRLLLLCMLMDILLLHLLGVVHSKYYLEVNKEPSWMIGNLLLFTG